jgi:hypothetical protein
MRNVAAGVSSERQEALTPRETELIRRHLRSLGYLE